MSLTVRGPGQKWIVLAVGLAIVLSGLGRSAIAQPTTPLDRVSPRSLASASRIVYQSDAGQGSPTDIWIMNGDGKSQTKLTSSAEADYMARLARGGSKIVYSRNASGSPPNLWTMNTDGSGQSQLTSTQDGEQFASWSPNGGQIAYAYVVDPNHTQIWAINADGSNPKQLTSVGDLNTTPSWTPDGLKIVFVSNRNGDQEIYCMTASGGNQVPVSSGHVSAGGPVVSPDGTKLAFVDDPNGDGYNLYVLDFDQSSCTGSNQKTLVDVPDPNVWITSPTWSPDSELIAYSQTHFTDPNTNKWDTGYIYTYDVTTSKTTQLTSSGREQRPSWATLDVTPPTSSCAPLPPYTNSTAIQLSWGGTDDMAGIKYYGVQVQEDAGPWVFWQVSTTETSGIYFGTSGHTYGFRCRAVDDVGNVESFPPAAESSTLLYTATGSGQVQDVRDRPVPYADLDLQPAPLVTFPPDANGSWLTYLGSLTQTLTVSASHTGYASPLASPVIPNGVSVTSVLPGMDDVALNGGFEQSFDGWTRTGQTSVVTTPIHSGVYVARLDGNASVSQIIPVSDTMHAPTLSAFYILAGADESQGSEFDLIVTDGSVQTTVYSSTVDSANWVHIWADLTPWLGKSVNVTFRLVAGTGGPVSAYVDEVSASSWHTPVLDPIGIRYLPAKVTTQLTLTGDNFEPGLTAKLTTDNGQDYPVTVDSVQTNQVVLTLPDTTPVGIYDLALVNPGGPEAVAARAIRLGAFLFLPNLRR